MEWLRQLCDRLPSGPHRPLHLTGLSGSAAPFVVAAIASRAASPVCVVCRREADATHWIETLQTVATGESFTVLGLPGEAGSTAARLSRRLSDPDEAHTRTLAGLHALLSLSAGTEHRGGRPLWVVTQPCLAWRPPEAANLRDHTRSLRRGQEFDRSALIGFLEDHGYNRRTLVERKGDYAVRGFVLDIFPPLPERPVRIEFEGDRVDDLREFDPETQRSTGRIESVQLVPLDTPAAGNGPRAVDLLPRNTLVVIDGYDAMLNELRGNDLDGPLSLYRHVTVEPLALLRPPAEAGDDLHFACRDLLDLRQALHVQRTRMRTSPAGSADPLMRPLLDYVETCTKAGGRVLFFADGEQRQVRLGEVLRQEGWEAHTVASPLQFCVSAGASGQVGLARGVIEDGFRIPDAGIAVIAESDIFGPAPRQLKPVGTPRAKGEEVELDDLAEGDYVVHAEYGVGRFIGVVELTMGEEAGSFVKIGYADDALVYLPVDRISLIQKYVGAEGFTPKLDRLGTNHWQRSKARVREDIKALARELAKLYARRETEPGTAYPEPGEYVRAFEATFPYEETPDQHEAIRSVYEALSRPRPMDFLVCGDVGYGKTEVALRAAFHVAMSGRQVAVLVPTTLLAYQHHETFRARLEGYPLVVRMLSRFVTAQERERVVEEIRSGVADIVIGTHRLLSRDVAFAQLGLLVIDEEHRFGVIHKERLKKLKEKVDVLTLTATPIPRTLHMALLGIRDYTTIETPPQERKDILTYVSPFEDEILRSAIEEELERKGQVFCVHNRIRGIHAMEEYLQRLVPSARIAVAHGRMNREELEDVMLAFLREEVDVLLSTAIIESGLDIPNANTIIVFDADRFGLAQLYQLRGRVGRSGIQARAYLILPGRELTRDAVKRIEAIQESGLGSGFRLARRDLEIRGGGEVLGRNQSGHIARVGFHLYLRLIEEAVREMKGQPVHPDIEPELHLPRKGSIPAAYVEEVALRVYFYRKCARATDLQALQAIREEMRDRFGPLPGETLDLFRELPLRLDLKRLGIESLTLKRGTLSLRFAAVSPVKPESLVRFVQARPTDYKMAPPFEVTTWIPRNAEPHGAIGAVLNRLKEELLETPASTPTHTFPHQEGKERIESRSRSVPSLLVRPPWRTGLGGGSARGGEDGG